MTKATKGIKKKMEKTHGKKVSLLNEDRIFIFYSKM